MTADRGNHQENVGFQRISCARQLTIPDTAGTTPDPAGEYTVTKSSKPNVAGHTPDFSYSLISSMLFPSSSLIRLSL